MVNPESPPPFPNPNHIVPPVPPAADPFPSPPPPPPPPTITPLRKRPTFRVTSEFDSDSLQFFHKVSCKLFDNLAKFKLSFRNNDKREILEPQLAFTSKHLSLHYDVEDQNVFIKSSVDVGSRLHFKAAHDVNSQQGEVAMVANLGYPGYAVELASPVPYAGWPITTLKFPMGEVSLQEREEEEVKKALSISGMLKGPVLDGICAAHYKDEELRLRYAYKDEAVSFIPSISFPSKALSLGFKRRLSPSDKLSYCYNFDSNNWNAVFKHMYGKDFKLKAGYDSEARLGWASLWVGDETGKAKTAPMKMKLQLMLQVPQDDIKSSALMFRVKKRWDI